MRETARAMALKNAHKTSRYTGKRIKQDSVKQSAIKKREARLNKIGWSLTFFD